MIDNHTMYTDDLPIDALQHAIMSARRGQDSQETICALLIKTIGSGGWRDRVVAKTGKLVHFDSFKQFVETRPPDGLGSDIAFLRQAAKGSVAVEDAIDRAVKGEQPHGGDHTSEVSKISNGKVALAKPPVGNMRAQALRRLRTSDKVEDQALYQKVMAGELTPNAAMILAGYRKKTATIPLDVEDAARILRSKFSADDLAQLAALLAREDQP